MGRVAYAALFVVVLPVALVLWAVRLDALLALPVVHAPGWGLATAAGGAGLALLAMRDLWMIGGGLPASPYPPTRLVTRGVYGLVPHPIYVGSFATSLGVSLWAGSPSGLWIVTPTLALMTAAWVIGFEHDLTRRQFGQSPEPAIRLPSPTEGGPTVGNRVAVYTWVYGPWLLLFYGVEGLGAPPDARSTYMNWDAALPVIPWTEAVYALTYFLCAAAPLLAATRRQLRTYAHDGLWATAMIIPFYLLVPLVAHAKPVLGDGFWEGLLRFERVGDSPATAFPSFHVVWTCITARLFVARWPRTPWVWFAVVAGVGAACVTTGMHSALDVLGGFAAYALVVWRRDVWRVTRDIAEALANSWREVHVGPVRIASHAIFTGLGTGLGAAIAMWLAGAPNAGWVAGVTVAAIAGAAQWAQVIEGSPQLLRPYGYFGSAITVLLMGVVAAAAGVDAWLLLAALATGGAFAHAIGRVRCLVHGCCHGRAAPEGLGIRYTEPKTRVVRLTTLGGIPIHPVQVYSLASLLIVGAILLRLWMLGAPLSFIAGVYAILTGLFRFVEEHFRGEPQTVVVGGIRLYQWLSIALVVAGAVLTTLGAAPAPEPTAVSGRVLPTLVGLALFGFFAYGADFPASSKRFSRLR